MWENDDKNFMNNRTQNIRIGLRTKTLPDSCTSEVCMEMMSRATLDFLIIVIFLLGCFSNFVFGHIGRVTKFGDY